MPSHLFILGRTPDLAFAELQTFFPGVKRLTPEVAVNEADFPVAPSDVLEKLGGTVKLGVALGEAGTIDAETIATHVDTTHGRTEFGVSVYGQTHGVSRKVLEEVKMLLEGRGASVRFVEGRGETLSSVVVAKNNVQEILCIKVGTGYIIGRTLAVQPFEEWGERDFGRPYADPQAGMLPPKVSRMAVNIANRSRDLTKPLSEKSLLDPFCGMGTILSEGLVMGWNVVGGDQDGQVVEKARGNLRWLTEKHDMGVTYRLYVSDAVHISEQVDSSSIDAIVTEPFMGDTDVSSRGRWASGPKNIIKGLEKLYIGCLRDWQAVLKPHGVVMMALPIYAMGGRTYFVKKVIDMCENLGYTVLTGPIEYGRPQAIVKRAFYLFGKK